MIFFITFLFVVLDFFMWFKTPKQFILSYSWYGLIPFSGIYIYHQYRFQNKEKCDE